MKKFLTVLLVIAVMFTFSFGSAFAATAPNETQAKLLAEAKAYAEGIVTANYDAAYSIVTAKTLQYTPTSISVKDAWGTVDVKAALQAHIDEKYVAAARNFTSSQTTKAKLAAELFATDTNATISEYTPNASAAGIASAQLAEVMFDLCEKEVTLAGFAADREAALSAFDKVDYSVYSDTEVDKTTGKTYLTLAKEKVAAGKANLSKQEIYDAETFDAANLVNLTASMAIFKGGANAYYTGGVAYYLTEKTINVNGNPVGLGIYTVNGVKTKSQLENEGITDAATAAQVKATAQKVYANYIVTTNPDKEFAEAYVKIVSYLADAGELTVLDPATDLSNAAIFTADVKNLYKNGIKNVAAMEAYAAKYKAEKDADGNLVRDSKAVDELVEEYTTAEYKFAAGLPGAAQPSKADCEDAIVAKTINKTEEGLAFAKQVAKNLLEDNKDAVIDDYYDLEAAKVMANYEKALAEIEAAGTIAKVQAVDISTGTMTAGINDADTVDANVSYVAGTPAQKALAALDAYITYTNSGKTVLDAGYIKATDAAKKNQINTIYGEAGARKISEMKAVEIDVAAIAEKLPTVGAIATAKADAEAAIKALPTSAKVADKDSVINAFDLAGAYGTITKKATGTAAEPENQAKLNTVITNLFADMQFDFAKKISAVDKTDKAALRALQDELDDANALIDDYEVFEGKTPNFDQNKVVAGAIEKIRDKELAAVKAAINAIPVNVTEADKAVVEAARKAYDEFVKDWTEYSDYDDFYAAGEVTNFRELALAEAELGLNYDAEENAKAYVQDLSIKARSEKTSKGVKVTIKADVQQLLDDGFTVEYRFYRSTKSNKNFGKPMIVKSTNTYTNTKGVKGTRYYYKAKIVVKNAAGEVVATTPLTQCLYATRVF